jgi:hypothetical protein
MKHLLAVLLLSLAPFAGATGSKLTAPDGQANQYFGYALSVSGNTLAVINGPDSSVGALYIYSKTDGTWLKKPTLTAELFSPAGPFYSVAVSGNTIVVGASQVAYVYELVNNGWQLIAQLTPSDGGGGFGFSTSFSEKTIVIGAPRGNKAYVFTEPKQGWTNMTETAILSPAASDNPGLFGWSVAVNAYFVAVGSPGDNDPYPWQGAVYLFQETKGGWQSMNETAKLTDSTCGQTCGGHLGNAVAIQITAIAAGEPGRSKIAVFLPSNGTWATTDQVSAFLTPAVPSGTDQFGGAIALNNSTIVTDWLNAQGQEKSQRGGVDVFREPQGGWVNQESDDVIWVPNAHKWWDIGENSNGGGSSLALESNAHTFVGEDAATVNGNENQGAVYVYASLP